MHGQAGVEEVARDRAAGSTRVIWGLTADIIYGKVEPIYSGGGTTTDEKRNCVVWCSIDATCPCG